MFFVQVVRGRRGKYVGAVRKSVSAGADHVMKIAPIYSRPVVLTSLLAVYCDLLRPADRDTLGKAPPRAVVW